MRSLKQSFIKQASSAQCHTTLIHLGFWALGETSSLIKDRLFWFWLEEVSFSIKGNFICLLCNALDIFFSCFQPPFIPNQKHFPLPLFLQKDVLIAVSRKLPWLKSIAVKSTSRFRFRTWLKGELWKLYQPQICMAKKQQHNNFLPPMAHNNFLEKITTSSQTAAVELKPFFPHLFAK